MSRSPVNHYARLAWLISLPAVLLLSAPTDGKGILTAGGALTIGISAFELNGSPSRPLPPLNSLLLDEIYETVWPLGSGTAMATWEEAEPGTVRMTLGASIVAGDLPSSVLTAEGVVACWEARAAERWDARWALRWIEGIDAGRQAGAPGIAGLQPFDDRILECSLKPGASIDDFRRALTSPALRLAIPSEAENNGTGPFLLYQASSDRWQFTTAPAHRAGRAYLDEVRVITYESAEESVLDFGRGSLDALLIASNEQGRFSESSRAASDRLETVADALLVLLFNPARLPTIEERRSLALAVDREGIARVVLGQGAASAADFLGAPAEAQDWIAALEEARRLYREVEEPRDELVLLVCDDPAARAAADRLDANWGSLGLPVEIRQAVGPLSLSFQADAVLISLRLPRGGEGVLPQCLALYDRSGWWEIAALALESDADILRRVRALDVDADLEELASKMESAGLAIPIARYGILFAPGPDVSLVPATIYPGPPLWRAFMGTLPEPEEAVEIVPVSE